MSFFLWVPSISASNEVLYGSAVRAATLVIALLFSFRSILAVFNNQQTDILILVGHIRTRAFTRVPVLASTLMAIGLASRQLFMVLLPIYKKRWQQQGSRALPWHWLRHPISPNMQSAIAGGIPTTSGLVLPKATAQGQFKAEAIAGGMWSYLREHYEMTLSVSPDEVRWWQDRGNAGSQSVSDRCDPAWTRRAIQYRAVGFNVRDLRCCCCSQAGYKDAVFVLGLLFYTAFADRAAVLKAALIAFSDCSCFVAGCFGKQSWWKIAVLRRSPACSASKPQRF